MTRFDILAILAAQSRPISCKRIAELTGKRGWYRRSFQADVATRLRRLYRWGLLQRWRVADGHFSDGRAIYLWSLSQRGLERLEWARRFSGYCSCSMVT
jgi:repressor of nif and glnA expression